MNIADVEKTLRAAYTATRDLDEANKVPTAPAHFISAHPQPPRRRGSRLAAGLAAAAAVIVVAAGATALVSRDQPQPGAGAGSPGVPHSTNQPPAPGAQPKPVPMRLAFAFAAPAGYVVTARVVNRHYDEVDLASTTPMPNNLIIMKVYMRGSYDSTLATRGVRVQVNGHDAYYGPIGEPAYASLAWEYAQGSWAVVHDTLAYNGTPAGDSTKRPEFRTIALKIANGVRLRASTPITVPFRFGYLPPGLVPNQVGAAREQGWVRFEDNLPVTGGALFVELKVGRFDPASCKAQDPPLVVAGYTGCVHPLTKVQPPSWELAVPRGWLSISVDVWHNSRYPASTLRKIISGMTLAPDISDTSTWFDATTALP